MNVSTHTPGSTTFFLVCGSRNDVVSSLVHALREAGDQGTPVDSHGAADSHLTPANITWGDRPIPVGQWLSNLADAPESRIELETALREIDPDWNPE